MKKYVTEINGIDLFVVNIPYCALVIKGIKNVHPAILKRVADYIAKQFNGVQWKPIKQ